MYIFLMHYRCRFFFFFFVLWGIGSCVYMRGHRMVNVASFSVLLKDYKALAAIEWHQ